MSTFNSAVAEVLGSAYDRAERAKLLVDLIRAARGFHWVGLYDVSATHISALAWTGDRSPVFPVLPIEQGLNGAAVASGEPVIVQDVSQDSRYPTTLFATQAEAIFPVLAQDGKKVVGTIDVESDRVDAFAPDDVAFLRDCAVLMRPLWG